MSNAQSQRESLRRETWQGEEYLVADVVAQREGVYEYPDPRRGVTREYVDGETLTANLEAWEDTTLVLRHPETADGEHVLAANSASSEGVDDTSESDAGVPVTEVGAFRNVRDAGDGDADGAGLAGEVWIEASEVGQHDGDLDDYVESVGAGDIGEVSTQYIVTTFDESGGRHNGTDYDREQAALVPDHLALLPDQLGNCSVADGCGVGRTNDGGAVRANRTVDAPSDSETPPVDEGMARTLIRGLRALLPDDEGGAGPTREGTDSPHDSTDDDGNEAAESARTQSAADQADTDDADSAPSDAEGESPSETSGGQSPMEDSDKIDILVEEHGFDRENVEKWEGEDCLARLFDRFEGETDPDGEGANTETDSTDADGETAPDADTETETGTGTETPAQTESPDAPETGGSGGSATEGEVAANEDAIREVVSDVLEEQQTEEAKAEHIDIVADNPEAPFDRDDLESMDADAVETIAEQYETAETAPEAAEDEAPRATANYAGRPTGPSGARANADDDDTPAAGYDNYAERQDGGD